MIALFTPGGDELVRLTSTGEVIVASVDDVTDKEKTRRLTSKAQVNSLFTDTWNLDAALLETLSDKKTGLCAFWLSADATLLTYADRKKKVHVLRLPGKQSLAELTRTQLVEVLVMDQAGRYLASAQKNRRIVVTDLESGENFPEITGYDATLTCMVFSSDGKQLASGHSDGSIALWSVATGQRFGFCFDPESSSDRGTSFTINGVALTYTQPCGSPIPPNATCTCNCVPGRAVRVTRSKTVKIPVQPPKPIQPATNQPMIPYFPTPFFFPSGGGSTCSCVPVCTCIPVFR